MTGLYDNYTIKKVMLKSLFTKTISNTVSSCCQRCHPVLGVSSKECHLNTPNYENSGISIKRDNRIKDVRLDLMVTHRDL